jgi:hypothetical protein
VADRPLTFKVDENLPADVARILREAGYDAVTIGAQHLSGTPDARLADVVLDEGRAWLPSILTSLTSAPIPPSAYSSATASVVMPAASVPSTTSTGTGSLDYGLAKAHALVNHDPSASPDLSLG